MLAIKLRRIGKKHQAAFRVIVSEKRSKVDGRYVDNIGWLNPKTKEFDIKKEKAQHWIKNGAQPTDTVHNLFVKAGVIEGPKISVHKKKKSDGKTPEKKVEAAGTEAPKAETAEESAS
jgi:small subunit ribosomal protein S16